MSCLQQQVSSQQWHYGINNAGDTGNVPYNLFQRVQWSAAPRCFSCKNKPNTVINVYIDHKKKQKTAKVKLGGGRISLV